MAMHKFTRGQFVSNVNGTVYKILDLVATAYGEPAYQVCQFTEARQWYGRVYTILETKLRPANEKGGGSTPPLNDRYRR